MKDPEIVINCYNRDDTDLIDYFRVSINGWSNYGFNITLIPEDKQQWMIDLVVRQLVEAYHHGAKDAKKEVLNGYNDFLKIME